MSEQQEIQVTAEVEVKNDAQTQIEGAAPKPPQADADLNKDPTAALKARVAQLEKDLAEAQKFKAQHAKDNEEVAALKEKSEDTLTKAKEIIFEKVKVIKNQELQIEALGQQISSLKEVVSITKDLLEIRNMEVKQLEVKIQCMEDRVGAEKERHDLMHKKLESMIRYNGELKREYETQLCLFKALRERYSERELAKGVLEEGPQVGASAAVAASAEAGAIVEAGASAEAQASTSASEGLVNGDATPEEQKKDEAK